MRCNKNTVFLLRHKVLDSISEIIKATKLKEKVQVDETYESINLKGTNLRICQELQSHVLPKVAQKEA